MTTILPRRGTAAQWTAANPVLAVGELGYETDTKKWKRGDGATAWAALAYYQPAWTEVTGRDDGVKKATGGIVPIEKYNPDSVGFSSALSSAIDDIDSSGGIVVLESGKTYTATDQVSKIDKDVRIDFNGAKVIRGVSMGNFGVLDLSYSNSPLQSVLSLSNVNYNWGGSATTTPSTRIELSSTDGWTAGDYATIVSDDPIIGANPTRAQLEGERVRVAAVSGNYLYLAKLLRVAVSTNVRIARMVVRDTVLHNPWIEDEPGSPASRNVSAISITQSVKPVVTGFSGHKLLSSGLKFRGCVDGSLHVTDISDLRTSITDAAYGYGVLLQSCNDFYITGARGSFLRHLITTGADQDAPLGSTDVWRFGSNIGHRIVDGNAGETGHAAFDTHEEASHVVYDNCYVGWNHREPDGSLLAFNIRGRNNIVKDSTSYGPSGVALSALDGGGNHLVVNHTHVIPDGYTGLAYSVDYSGMSSRGNAEVSGRAYAVNFTGNIFQCNKAFVRVHEMQLVYNSAQSPNFPINLVDSEVVINTLVVDLRGSTGESRLLKLADSTSSVKIGRLVVLSGGSAWRIADFSGFDGSVMVAKIETDTLPNSLLVGNAGAGATYNVGEMFQNQKSIFVGVDYWGNTSGNANSLSKDSQVLDVPITNNRTVGEPTSIIGGIGRQLLYTRTANSTGAYSWTIGGDALTGPGTWLRRMFSSSGWVTVAKGYTTNINSATATLDFPSISAQSSQDLTITVTGAALGDSVALGVPTTSVTAGVMFTAWVSAANTVTVRAHNYSTAAADPASGSFKATIVR